MFLFRDEVLNARKQSLFGNVVFDQPLPVAILSFFVAIISVSAMIYTVLDVYSRTEIVPGYVSSETAFGQIFALRPTVIAALHVDDGNVVRAGFGSNFSSAESQIGLQREIVLYSGNTVMQLEQFLLKGFTSKIKVELQHLSEGSSVLDYVVTAHLDVATEALVSQVTQRLDITRIIVAHRPETIRRAEQKHTAIHRGG